MKKTHDKDQSPQTDAAKKPESKKSPRKSSRVKKPAKSGKKTARFADYLYPEPPEGFVVIGTSQVITEFAQPLLEKFPFRADDIKKINQVFSVVPEIWNYTLEPPSKKKEADMVSLISRRLGFDKKRAQDFLNMMTERREFLFPLDIQPQGTPFLFMRKQVCYLIDQFDYKTLDLVPEVLGPDALDNEWVAQLRELDLCIKKSVPYDKCEKLLNKVEDAVAGRFGDWLQKKNAGEYEEDFLFISTMYLEFIYAYEHEAPITLTHEPGKYIVGFCVDFLLRKTSIPAWKYALAPASLKLFYTFLYEKEYLSEPPDHMFQFLDSLDPLYVELLKEEFS